MTDLTVGEFVRCSEDLMIPAGDSLSFFSVVAMDKEETERLVFGPFGALPPEVLRHLPNLGLVLVPYLERPTEKAFDQDDLRITFSPPSESARHGALIVQAGERNLLFLPVGGDDTYDAHLELYGELAHALRKTMGDVLADPFNSLLDRELGANVRGEVDGYAWNAKRALQRLDRGENDADLLAGYRLMALERTLLLYLHGLCCDITVEAGPQQLPTKYMRMRLLQLRERFPPPKGVPLFPEEIESAPARSPVPS